MIILKCVPHVQHVYFCRSANRIFTLWRFAVDDIDAKAPYMWTSGNISFVSGHKYGLYPQAYSALKIKSSPSSYYQFY